MNAKTIAEKTIEQWDKHDKFRIADSDTLLFSNGLEPDEVVMARALSRSLAEISRMRSAMIQIRRSFGHKSINADTSTLAGFIDMSLPKCSCGKNADMTGYCEDCFGG